MIGDIERIKGASVDGDSEDGKIHKHLEDESSGVPVRIPADSESNQKGKEKIEEEGFLNRVL